MRFLLLTVALLFSIITYANISIQQVDPFVKILPGAFNQAPFITVQSVAYGDKLVIQLLLKSDENVSAVLSLTSTDLPAAAIQKIRKYRVGYVKVTPRIGNVAADQLKSPNQYYPDPLFEESAFIVQKSQPLPVILDIPVDKNITPGMHNLKVTIASADKKTTSATVVSFQVFNVTITGERMDYTNWYHDANYKLMNNGKDVKPFSDEYWKIFKNIVQVTKDNGQTAFTINPMFLIRFLKGKAAGWAADYTQFDRAVDIILKEVGMKWVVSRHFANRMGGWEAPFGFIFPKFYSATDYMMDNRSITDTEANGFYRWFVADYYKHLQAKNYLKHILQHVADEPIPQNEKSYIEIAKFVKALAPNLTTIEAVFTMGVSEYVDIMVVNLQSFPQFLPAIQQQQKKFNKKFWLYTSNWPQGNYANRFIELPLIKTTLLPWIAYKYNMTGYLHWGLDFWGDKPYEDASTVMFGTAVQPFPGGDPYIVYPAFETINVSLRFLATRNGLIDVALLDMLSKKKPKDAARINNDIIQSFDRYNLSSDNYFKNRKELLTLLSR